MLSDLFSFEGRLGRLGYLFRVVGVVLLEAIAYGLIVALAFAAGSVLLMIVAVLVVVGCSLANFWIMLALQARRLRDIGWQPLIVIPCLIVFFLVDIALAHLAPAFAVHGHPHQTPLGIAGSIALVLVLLLMPGDHDEAAGTGLPPLDRFGSRGSAPPVGPSAYPTSNGTPRRLFGKA